MQSLDSHIRNKYTICYFTYKIRILWNTSEIIAPTNIRSCNYYVQRIS